MNPVNEYLGPFLERAFEPLIDGGYLAIVYGGGEVGAYLCEHPSVDDIHITGSDKTHDLIVWGPPGAGARRPQAAQRSAAEEADHERARQREPGDRRPRSVHGRRAPQHGRERRRDGHQQRLVQLQRRQDARRAEGLGAARGVPPRSSRDVLAALPPRKAYYPGAFQRYEALTTGHADVRKLGAGTDEALPWTLVLGLDAGRPSERNFFTEPFCAILSEVVDREHRPARVPRRPPFPSPTIACGAR